MILSLIGMSGSGKTHWSRTLSAHGFPRISCDDRVEERLISGSLLSREEGGIAGVARWMGQPYEPGYDERQAAYLDAEARVMKEILDALERDKPRDLVIDTTGSVVYLGDEICRRLQASTVVVYLETSPQEIEEMLARYLEDPKPVVWGESFRRREQETDRDALVRCYRGLLDYRKALYERYASVRIPASWLRKEQTDAEEFLSVVRRYLQNSQAAGRP